MVAKSIQPNQPNPEPDPTTWLRTLDTIEGTDLSLVGGKAFRLARLKQNGLDVPAGLILTATFFETQVRQMKLTPMWMGSPDIAVTTEALGWLADTLKTKPLASSLQVALRVALDELFGDRVGQFAVRSSALDEDHRDHSFAGIHLTELDVPRSMLSIAITRCWASALSDAALEYRQVHGMSIQGIRVAVLIQPMLTPTCSGVGFTLDPLTGNRNELVIESTWGLGQPLVSGTIQPYLHKLSTYPPDYPVLETQPGSVASPNGDDSSPLSIDDLKRLAYSLEQVEALMGEPQDIEWAKQGDTFFILQTRPVIVTEAASASSQLNSEWVRGSHPEYLPELPSPFFSSLWSRSEHPSQTFFSDLGLNLSETGPFLKLILGRPYASLTFLKRIIAQVGIAPGNLLFTIGHSETKSVGRPLSIDWGQAFRARHIYWSVLKRLLINDQQLERARQESDQLVEHLDHSSGAEETSELLSQLRRLDQIYGQVGDVNLGLIMGLSATTAIGSSLIAPLTEHPASVLTTIAQKPLKTSEAEFNERLQKLGQLAQRDGETLQYFTKVGAALADIDMETLPETLRPQFEKLLTDYGHRATYDADPGQPRYHETPEALLQIIRQYALNPIEPTASVADSQNWRSMTKPKGLSRVIPWRCWLAMPFVYRLRNLIKMREVFQQVRGQVMGAGRRWGLRLGQHWAERGWLNQADDIFWLTIDEIERTLMAEDAMSLNIAATVQARKETYQTYAKTPMPYSLFDNQIFAIELGQGLQREAVTDTIIGLPISPGQVRGKIKIVTQMDDIEITFDDTILVMPSTDPALLPLLHRAIGLIVETGGLLSHGSVIAREYGIPGVANIPDATRQFQDGEAVLLDGSTGVVQRLGR